MAIEDRIRLPALNLIHRRPRLLNLLTEFLEANHRFITIYAPGGYGKSVLLADFTQTINLPVCWCSLEPVDRDPTSFLTLLVYSITDRFHDIERESLLRLVERGNTQNSIGRIAKLLQDVGPHLIIIDDYHKAVSAGMTLALNKLLDQFPETSKIIVAARGDMALETGQVLDLLLTERTTGLSEEELRFTTEELQLMMRKRFGRRIDPDTATEIAQATDGNIAQILLAGHMMRTDAAMGSLKQHLGTDQEIIYQYLAQDIFGKQPPHLQRFLLHTAVLPDMTPEICNALLDISNAQLYIEDLVRKDLFIAQVGGGFRYHDLFAEFLRSRLSEDVHAYRQINVKAAEILVTHGRYEDAIYLYLSAQAWNEAAILLERQGSNFYSTGRALTLNAWLAQIPEAELAQRPRLLVLQGQILTNDLGNPKLAMRCYQQAEEQFQRQNNMIGVAEANIYRSVGLRMVGRPTEALPLASNGLAQLETLGADKRLIAYAIRNRGMAYLIAGGLAEALLDLRRALTMFEQLDDTYSMGICHHELGICLERQGNISGAGHHYQQAMQVWEALGNGNDLANTLNSLGVCALLKGNYSQALERLQDSLDIALQIGAIRRAAFAQASMGDVYLARQEYELAINAYVLSTEFAREVSGRTLEIYNLVKVAECFYQQQNLAQALRLATEAKEIAAETGLIFEQGLALALQAKIYVGRAEYAISFNLFSQAAAALAGNDVLELAKTRLWWGYSLLMDLRASAALEQIQKVIHLTLSMGELTQGLGQSAREIQHLLLHFLHRADTPAGLREGVWSLVTQSQQQIDLTAPDLQVFIFGPPMIIVNGQRRQFRQRGRIRKMPEFLAYLLLEGQGSGCRWSEVSAALWPDLEPDKASTSFHQILKKLRLTLEYTDCIVLQDDYYQVNPNNLTWCDGLAFEHLLTRIEQVAVDERLALQLEIINLYQGEFLAGFELSDWGAAYRTWCEAKFFQVVKQTAEQLLKQSLPQDALVVINKGLGQDVYREDLHRMALKAYAHLGRYDEVSIQYRQLRQTFDEEFGAPLEPETEQLYEQLISQM